VLHLHRAERADGLVEALRALLADPLPDPLAPELIAVPTRGMERWLTQRLSAGLGTSERRGDGVCANVEFPTPRRLVGDAVAAAVGVEDDPWLPERAVWPLLEVVEASLHEPWLARLAGHLAGNPARRFATVRHLADLFDRYALHRPDMVRAWAAGDGPGPDAAWQAELWRRLRGRIAEPDPAERLARACARLREQPDLVDLPPRLSLFGLTRLPAGRVDVLDALAAHRDVHLFALHPSPALWEKLAPPPAVARRRDDPTTTAPTNRLLASWGNDSRELQLVLGEHVDHHHPVAAPAASLLGRLQAAVREDREPERGWVGTDIDRSVQVHSCHGRARQVEVLRAAILHELAEDPTLEPRDVIVMCPNIETFAPLIQATFGAGEESDLRVRLADRSVRQTNPVLGVVARLLELADQRLTVSQVLDLADREPVRRRFGFDDDELGRIEEWVRASGIRWGLDAAHRAPFKLAQLPHGTWRAGLDRLLLGVAMTEDERRLFEKVLPLDDVESDAIDLAGRFAEFLDRLRAAVDALREAKPIGDWAEALATLADALTDPHESWQRSELQRLLDDAVAEAGEHTTELALEELRAALADRIKGRPTRANFRTGHLTVCTLVPMRSIPHRVVCLLGLDDGVFPRKGHRDGDDLMLADPRIGERDARSEDRQLLLDALMAATDRLIITYTGNDERTNLEKPPAVPVGELLDITGTGVVTRHPLQPFDPRNFTAGELVPDRVWSFEHVTLDGARALMEERSETPPFVPGPLPPPETSVIELADFVRFFERPVRAFLRQRLNITVGDYDDALQDALPVALDALEVWGVGQRLLDARLAGVEPRTSVLAEIARGTLPPGVLGKPVIDRVQPTVEQIVAYVPAGGAGSVDVKVALADGRTLGGTVAGVVGDVLRTVTYSRVSPRHRLAAWVRLLALTVAHPGRGFEALTIGRAPARSDADVTIARLAPLDAALARDHLDVLVDLYDRGMHEPAPLACLTSAAYAEACRRGHSPIKPAREAWESTYDFDREDREPEHQLVLGGVLPFTELMQAGARPDERWDMDETRRFGRWARRLWDGLLDHERLEDR
jgi:exodeoxyribonuclease V gamma subunit